MTYKNRFRPGSMQIITTGFALLIIIGAILLSLPISNRNGDGIPFINAMFTSASATCVTGLVVYDTYMQFTFFGQLVILSLIQIGGLGFMTIIVLFSLIIGKHIGLYERSLLMESISTLQLGGIIRLVKRVLIGTAVIELTGACLLTIRFIPMFGLAKGIWFSVFHSVSAFCNAGFDLMGAIEPFSSLVSFSGDIIVNVTIISLIIIGGIGFIVWDDIAEKKWQFKKFRLHTKIMLSYTFLLIILSAVVFFFIETDEAFASMGTVEKILASLFHSVTPRTAGFNTVPLADLSEAGSLITIILMFIGAGSGSTGGGIKVTTFVVILLSVASYARRRIDLNIFNRRLEDGCIKRAASSIGLYLMICMFGVFVLSGQGFGLKDSLFEAFSAIGTVGLSTGITSSLPVLSRIVVIILMYSGRVGSLSVVMAVTEHNDKVAIKNMSERIVIG
ncbi:MAG: TrkH family potassium uptake protein [Eubacteriales bacterium]